MRAFATSDTRNTPEFDDDVQAPMRRGMPRVAAHVARSTIPLLAATATGRRGVEGTGVLIRISNERFIVTAAHVVEPYSRKGCNAWLATPAERDDVEPIPLVGWRGHCTLPGRDGTHDDDPLDIAWIALEPAHAARLGQRFRFLDRSDLATEALLDQYAIVSIYGFPSCLVTNAADLVDVQDYHFAAQLRHHVPEGIERFDPATQFLIAADGVVRHGPDGELRKLPNLRGMSGCGAWLIGHLTAEGRPAISPERPRLIGIENAWQPASHIRCTRIRVALEGLASTHPDLRPAMRVILP